MVFLWEQRINFGAINFSLIFITNFLFPNLVNCRNCIIFWLIIFFFQILPLISYLRNPQTLCFPRFTAVGVNDCLCTEFNKSSEFSCLYCNLPYQVLKSTTCVVYLHFLVIPLIIFVFQNPPILWIFLFSLQFFSLTRYFFQNTKLPGLSTFGCTLSHKFCDIRRTINIIYGW